MGPDDIRELFPFRAGRGAPHVRRRRHLCGRADVRLVHDSVIYLKADEQNAPAFEAEKLPPFAFATKDGKRGVMSYRRMPDRLYDDPDELAAWARDALAAAQRKRKTPSSVGKARKPKRRS